MSIERFTKEEFEAALPTRKSGSAVPLWESVGLSLGEYTYTMPVEGTNKRIVIRSSVRPDGTNAPTGKDSIRHYIEYLYKDKWWALGKHDTSYTTRVPGWEVRLAQKLKDLYLAALSDDHKRNAPKNPPAGPPEKPPVGSSENDNPPPDDIVRFLEGDGEVVDATPRCPKCDREMVKRTRRRDGKAFWGCPGYPKCFGTRNIEKLKPILPTPQEPQREIVWSELQMAMFEAIADETAGNLVIRAVAGSGKTVSLVEGLNYTDKELRIAFLAFNRRIANTFAGLVPPHVHASTFHSLGLGNVRSALGKVKVDNRKLFYIIRAIKDSLSFEQALVVDAAMNSIQRIISLLKACLLEPTSESMDWITDRWLIELNDDRSLIHDVAIRAYKESVADTRTVDFDDMIFFCASGMVPCEQFDMLFVDETQDLNKAQLEMAMRSVKVGGRIVAVGDPAQSIYGFRGADTEAMPRIIEALEATVLPLSITYRCPKSHVKLAQEFVADIEAAEWAEEGTIATISEHQLTAYTKPGDLVMCRVNAPLVKPAFALIRQGIKAVILGRDIGTGLINLVKKVQKRARVHTLEDTLSELSEYGEREIYKLRRRKKEMRAEALSDRIETIFALSDGCYTMADLERKIERVFSDEEEGVTFSSVHKVKGGEAERVFILKPDLMPHPKATSAWELEQEANIQYVAVTRSKSELYFVV